MNVERRVKRILCNPSLVQSREYHIKRLQDLYNGVQSSKPFLLYGINGQSDEDIYSNPERWVESALNYLALKSQVLLDLHVFRPLVLDSFLYGVHFADRFFGADVFFTHQWWWTRGVRSPLGELPVPDFERNETWMQAVALTHALVNSGVTVPFICPQVIGSPLNQIFNLYKEKLLIGFYDEPDKIKRDLGVITDSLCEMYKRFIKIIPENQFQPICAIGRCQPRGYGQIDGCATQLISAEIYNEFILPFDNQLLSMFPNGGMIHLCGSHTQHLKTWKEMRLLKAIQINDRATEDFEAYLEGLRNDQIIYLCPTETITTEKAMNITKGRRIVIYTDKI